MIKFPQEFNEGHGRTLQRRLADWRKKQHPHEVKMRELLLSTHREMIEG